MIKVTDKPQLHQDWIDPHALSIVKALQRRGHTTYLVGGCVRDLLLGIAPKDFDIATSAYPEDVRRAVYQAYLIGKRFKLVLVKRDHKQYEVATFRRDVREDEDTTELPVGDNLFGTPKEDAFRRDFTVNSLFYDPVANQLIDFAGGQADLEARVVRTIGDPNKRLVEDPIRILRALRLAHMIGFVLAPELRQAMALHAPTLAQSVLPRRREELLKLLRLPNPALAFVEAYDLGILQVMAPSLHQVLAQPDLAAHLLHDLSQIHDRDLDKQSAAELFGYLVWAFVRTTIEPDPQNLTKVRDLLAHETLQKFMRDELGMFKVEQGLVMRALQMQSLLAKRAEFERRGVRRQQAVLLNESFPLALQIAGRDYGLSASDLHFWQQAFAQHVTAGGLGGGRASGRSGRGRSGANRRGTRRRRRRLGGGAKRDAGLVPKSSVKQER